MLRSKHLLSFVWVLFAAIPVVALPVPAIGWEPEEPNDAHARIRTILAETVTPFLQHYCHDCHGAEIQEAKLDLMPLSTVESLETFHQTWDEVAHRLEAGEMPPDGAVEPEEDARSRVVLAIRQALRELALQKAGDPGPVITRRLSHAEYNYTIRDLTGVDLQPTREFPVDPANEAGFDNSGESLAMSPSLMQKYLTAARQVAEHLVLTPRGLQFAPHPMVTDTDRDKFAVRRIVDFYLRQPTDLADYFHAAWEVKVSQPSSAERSLDAENADDSPSIREENEPENGTGVLDRVALAKGISPQYLRRIWDLLHSEEPKLGPLGLIQETWNSLPQDPADSGEARRKCEQLRDRLARLRRRLEPEFPNLELRGGHLGSQQFVLWKNDQYAAHRRLFVPSVIESIEAESEEAREFPELLVPNASDSEIAADFEAGLHRFCDLFPDAFFISERGRDYVGKRREEQEKGRLLSAGFHSMMGYYRDDRPLYDLILDDAGRAEIDRLWQELDFITAAPLRQYTGFVWFERTDSRYMRDEVFDFARAEDKAVTDDPMIRRLAGEYRAKAVRNGGSAEVLDAIDLFFERINAQIRWVEESRLASEPTHLESLLEFADRAYRRPLSEDERTEWLEFYRELREVDELAHEEAMQDSVVAILLSPNFWYRVDLVPTDDQRRELQDWELASRLSYFLWASMPDEELRSVVDEGRLRDPSVLVAQAERMLGDEGIRALAVEFAGNWLDFRHFQQHNSVDRERFPQFTDTLRQAMFEEPVRFFLDLVQRDASVLEFLEADHTWVNRELAEHYGVEFPELRGESLVESPGEEWRRVAVSEIHRGGLLPMAVFQTVNSPGLRTSPVKRGYWVARRILGEQIPPPPPDVPELPEDEEDLGAFSLAEVLAKHRDHAACAGCHDRFDSLGLALENFDPIGGWRSHDLAGNPVEGRVEFPGGVSGEGLDGLRRYIWEHRRQDFVDHLSRQLLSYALGRKLILSDEPLVDEMRLQLEEDDYRFSSLIKTIITSSQFLEKRGRQSS
jgi:hypothetical protein